MVPVGSTATPSPSLPAAKIGSGTSESATALPSKGEATSRTVPASSAGAAAVAAADADPACSAESFFADALAAASRAESAGASAAFAAFLDSYPKSRTPVIAPPNAIAKPRAYRAEGCIAGIDRSEVKAKACDLTPSSEMVAPPATAGIRMRGITRL